MLRTGPHCSPVGDRSVAGRGTRPAATPLMSCELGREGREELPRPATRRKQLIASLADGQDPHREVGRTRVGEGTQPPLHVGFCPERRDVTDVGGVALVEQPLVVGGVLGVTEDAIRPFARRVHFVGSAHSPPARRPRPEARVDPRPPPPW